MIQMIQLEITGKCQLACSHCYASSGPGGTHGTMTTQDWQRVITQAAAMGVPQVQLIGGEPTLHPGLGDLTAHAVESGLGVEVYSNLVHIRSRVWDLLARSGAVLATSYYSDRAEEHDGVTGRRGSHARTRANIAQAVARGVGLRVGVIAPDPGQADRAVGDLVSLGVPESAIGVDQVRPVGRATDQPSGVDALCGQCGLDVVAVGPQGEVWPCTMSRWMVAGSVLEEPLADILEGPRFGGLVDSIPRPVEGFCAPDACNPNCAPMSGCMPKKACSPNGKFTGSTATV